MSSGVQEGDPRAYSRIVGAIRSLAVDPRPAGSSKLSGFDPPAWRIRVGEYRIVYEIWETEVVVIVVNVAPRSEVYR